MRPPFDPDVRAALVQLGRARHEYSRVTDEPERSMKQHLQANDARRRVFAALVGVAHAARGDVSYADKPRCDATYATRCLVLRCQHPQDHEGDHEFILDGTPGPNDPDAP